MSNLLALTIIILIPAFLLIAEDVQWEKLSLISIRRIGDWTDARLKLEELGYVNERSYENYRYRQIILIFLAIALEIIATAFLSFSVSKLIALIAFSLFSILYFTESALARELKRHRDSIEADFPAIVETLTLSLSAGVSPLTSMQRIASRGQGALAHEFSKVIREVTDGTPFATALDAMGRRVKSTAVRRFVDSIVIAVTRGAPLIDVLHSHAQEARDLQRNRVLSAASKAELSMMIPVVFLILPISILFALWPSLSNLNLFAQG
jgi:tight adherence protein C